MPDWLKFIHLTDPHLVAAGELFNLHPDEQLAACVESIRTHHSDAAFCTVTGDITHLAEPEAARNAAEILARLPMPCHVIPGNHDTRTILTEAFPSLPRTADGFQQYGLDVAVPEHGAAWRFLFLDSLDEGTSVGVLCEARLGWIEAELKAAEGRPVCVFLHHAPLEIGIPALDRIRLKDMEALYALLTAHGDVRRIFFGHLHRPVHGDWRGIPFSTVRATAHQVGFNMQEGPLLGARERPEYAVVLMNGDTTVIHNHSYLEEDTVFDYARPDRLLGTGDGIG